MGCCRARARGSGWLTAAHIQLAADQSKTVAYAQIAGASELSAECRAWAADLIVAEQVLRPALDPLPPVLARELDVEPVS